MIDNKTLYIIGNGFDLWHGLPTTYDSFYNRASDNLAEYEEYFCSYANPNIPWSDFENDLGEYDWQSLYSEQELPDVSSDDFRPSYVYGLEDGISEQTEQMVQDISDEFESWVCSIDISAAKPKMSFNKNSKFLSFNYTSTLQQIYQVNPKYIKHIHGNVDNHESIIFGHGVEVTPIEEFDKEGESTRTMFSDAEGAARYPLQAFQKPVKSIIDLNIEWFDLLIGVDVIAILGHSLNEVDLPYFNIIASICPNAKWLVSCYSDAEHVNHRNSLCSLGIKNENIVTCSLDEMGQQVTNTVNTLNLVVN